MSETSNWCEKIERGERLLKEVLAYHSQVAKAFGQACQTIQSKAQHAARNNLGNDTTQPIGKALRDDCSSALHELTALGHEAVDLMACGYDTSLQELASRKLKLDKLITKLSTY